MGEKDPSGSIRVLLGHQCRSFHDKPRGGWFNAAVMWFCLQIWQPQIGQICSSHVKPIKNGVRVETMGDSPPWRTLIQRPDQRPRKKIKLHVLCENSLEIHDCHGSILGFPKVCKNTCPVSFDPPHLPCDVRFAPRGSHATHTPTVPLSWKKSNGLENHCPMRIAAGNSSSQPRVLNGVPWQEMGRAAAKSAEHEHHIQFQTSGFRKKFFRAWCGFEVENVLPQQESHVFFRCPKSGNGT